MSIVAGGGRNTEALAGRSKRESGRACLTVCTITPSNTTLYPVHWRVNWLTVRHARPELTIRWTTVSVYSWRHSLDLTSSHFAVCNPVIMVRWGICTSADPVWLSSKCRCRLVNTAAWSAECIEVESRWAWVTEVYFFVFLSLCPQIS